MSAVQHSYNSSSFLLHQAVALPVIAGVVLGLILFALEPVWVTAGRPIPNADPTIAVLFVAITALFLLLRLAFAWQIQERKLEQSRAAAAHFRQAALEVVGDVAGTSNLVSEGRKRSLHILLSFAAYSFDPTKDRRDNAVRNYLAGTFGDNDKHKSGGGSYPSLQVLTQRVLSLPSAEQLALLLRMTLSTLGSSRSNSAAMPVVVESELRQGVAKLCMVLSDDHIVVFAPRAEPGAPPSANQLQQVVGGAPAVGAGGDFSNLNNNNATPNSLKNSSGSEPFGTTAVDDYNNLRLSTTSASSIKMLFGGGRGGQTPSTSTTTAASTSSNPSSSSSTGEAMNRSMFYDMVSVFSNIACILSALGGSFAVVSFTSNGWIVLLLLVLLFVLLGGLRHMCEASERGLYASSAQTGSRHRVLFESVLVGAMQSEELFLGLLLQQDHARSKNGMQQEGRARGGGQGQQGPQRQQGNKQRLVVAATSAPQYQPDHAVESTTTTQHSSYGSPYQGGQDVVAGSQHQQQTPRAPSSLVDRAVRVDNEKHASPSPAGIKSMAPLHSSLPPRNHLHQFQEGESMEQPAPRVQREGAQVVAQERAEDDGQGVVGVAAPSPTKISSSVIATSRTSYAAYPPYHEEDKDQHPNTTNFSSSTKPRTKRIEQDTSLAYSPPVRTSSSSAPNSPRGRTTPLRRSSVGTNEENIALTTTRTTNAGTGASGPRVSETPPTFLVTSSTGSGTASISKNNSPTRASVSTPRMSKPTAVIATDARFGIPQEKLEEVPELQAAGALVIEAAAPPAGGDDKNVHKHKHAEHEHYSVRNSAFDVLMEEASDDDC
ncbi:unnamed protein product [Amoebophrya sp. A25]|nr:unnamed protein product [Amoebophrya sp. A25]|eukprot:GSA25T00003002001.1